QQLVTRAENHLRVLAMRERAEARVAGEVRRGPFPHVADELPNTQRRRPRRVRTGRRGPQVPLSQVGVLGAGILVAPGVAARAPGGLVEPRGLLPLRFGRQASARPAGEGLGLVVADVAYRLLRGDPPRGPRPGPPPPTARG